MHLAKIQRVEVEYADPFAYRGDERDLDTSAAMVRTCWGLLTHLTESVCVVVHDKDPASGDIYATVIPRASVISLTYVDPKEGK